MTSRASDRLALLHPWNAEVLRAGLNRYPPYEGAGIEITHVADDASEIRVRMTLTDENANLVGTHFGGSLYSMVDPHLMILLTKRLGPEFVVWDKSATIDFVKPGVGTVHATMRVTDDEVEALRRSAETDGKQLPQWTVDIVDEEGDVVARVLKTIYVRRAAKARDR